MFLGDSMNRLKDLRQDKDLLQKDLFEKIGISQKAISNYETEKTDIPTQALKNLAIFYETSVDYILGITNEKRPYPRKKDLN